MQNGIDLAGQIDQRVARADMGRAQHVTLKGFDLFQHLGRLHRAFGLPLDDHVEMIGSLEFLVDVAHALIVFGVGPEQRRAGARIADGEKLIPVKTPEDDDGETGDHERRVRAAPHKSVPCRVAALRANDLRRLSALAAAWENSSKESDRESPRLRGC